MWFISYNNSQYEYCYVKKTFEHKADAFKYINSTLNKNIISNIHVNNGDSNLITPTITEGVSLLVCENNTIYEYGIIHEITDYLVNIRKLNGDIVEFTKSRINKEFIKGRFLIK